MATKIRRTTSQKKIVRFKRKRRIRASLSGTFDKPRFSVFRSNRYLYAQLIDDGKGHTLVSASSLEEELKEKVKLTVEGAKTIGHLIAKRALSKNISSVVFDRGGYLYHGCIKALADAAREAGLKF